MIHIDSRPPTDVLIEALGAVEDAEQVVIVLEKPGMVIITANCMHKEIVSILEQAKHLTIKELFDVPRE